MAALDSGVFETEDELVSNCILLLFAGDETTTNLLAAGLYHLLGHPGELERLRRDPSLAPSAVEELLRYDNPAHDVTRVVRRDVELGAVTMRPGERVFPFVTAANRDPKVFTDSDTLDIGRRPNRHLSFGASIHFCLNASLARLESRARSLLRCSSSASPRCACWPSHAGSRCSCCEASSACRSKSRRPEAAHGSSPIWRTDAARSLRS